MFRVLLVENDPLDNYITLNLLNKSGHDLMLSLATNGQEALTRLKNTRPLPDIILLDLHMPVMDGFEFIRAVKQTLTPDEISYVRMIVLTTPNKTETYKPEKLGVFGVLTKPLDLAAFEALIRSW